MRESLEWQLADFLKKRRGPLTLSHFARKLGLPPSTLFRLENVQQSATLAKLRQIMERLGCSLTDIFPQ